MSGIFIRHLPINFLKIFIMKTSLILRSRGVKLTYSLLLFVFISSCNNSQNNQKQEYNKKETIEQDEIKPYNYNLSRFYLNIPLSLSYNECESFMNRLEKDSLIREGHFISDFKHISDIEQRYAGLQSATSEYCFQTNFVIKDSQEKYKDIEPHCSLFFYKSNLLALQITLLSTEIDNILKMYISKYGEPQVNNLEIEPVGSKIDEYIFKNIYDHNKERERTWKEKVHLWIFEWYFLNSTIKIIKSSYDYHSVDYENDVKLKLECSHIDIFYINNETIVKYENDKIFTTDSIEKVKQIDVIEKRRKDSIDHINAKNIYSRQEL